MQGLSGSSFTRTQAVTSPAAVIAGCDSQRQIDGRPGVAETHLGEARLLDRARSAYVGESCALKRAAGMADRRGQGGAESFARQRQYDYRAVSVCCLLPTVQS